MVFRLPIKRPLPERERGQEKDEEAEEEDEEECGWEGGEEE